MSTFTVDSEKCAKVPSWEIRTFRGAPAPVPTVGGEAVPRIRYWNEPEGDGHFAAFERPKLFVDEVRAFFRLVR